MSDVHKDAALSPCGTYRYLLTRSWGELGKPRLTFIMLNPSTADATVDDPTIRRCMGFARREGYPGIVVANLFAFRATKPADLWAAHGKVCISGPENEQALFGLAKASEHYRSPIVCAWGAGAKWKATFVGPWLRAQGAHTVCLGKTADGHPRHPLYVRGDQPFEAFP